MALRQITLLFLFLFQLSVLAKPPLALPDDPIACQEALKTLILGQERGKTNQVIKTLAFMQASQAKKVEIWEAFVSQMRRFNDNYRNDRHLLLDATIAYRGHQGETLLIDKSGEIYLFHVPEKQFDSWTPPWDRLKKLRDRYQPNEELSGIDQYRPGDAPTVGVPP